MFWKIVKIAAFGFVPYLIDVAAQYIHTKAGFEGKPLFAGGQL